MAAILVARRDDAVDLTPASPEAALCETLSTRGLACEAADVVWLKGASGVRGAIEGGAHALVRARASATGDPSDLYLVDVRLSPEGAVLQVGDDYDVTSTSGVDESRPVLHGSLAAYTTTADGLFTGVHVIDMAGRAEDAYEDFSRIQRMQVALTNLQQTGRRRGLFHVAYALDPVARAVTFAFRDDGNLEITADDHAIVVDPHAVRPIEGDAYLRVVPDERARPGNLVTWAVDRVRALPWFGDDRMQWIKAVAFTALDGLRSRLSHNTTAQDVQDELGLPAGPAGPTTFVDPEIGFPPPPMKGSVMPPLPGEGQWIALDHDKFITPTAAGTLPAFVTSFIRPDAHRLDVRVYITLWDPRQIELHVQAGTVEPIAANGEHGPGLVPRKPGVLSHLVAGFNGGFQAQHGEYGMAANGVEYLPPKPYAATVTEMRDGSNGFGAWPAGETAAPDDVVAYRQNLTALVQDGKFNPWGRSWWGGTPPGWPDQIHSARSALCLTSEGFVGYFYSSSISADDLAAAMLAARCQFGLHLDMNPGHAGFEFYNAAPEGKLPPLGRPLQSDWEADGKVSDMPGWVFRARRMIRGMGHMLFPRYIQRESRDFFYLTSRAILPGAPLSAGERAEPDEGRWRTQGLPQHGFPFALATTWVRAQSRPGLKLRIVRADPRTLKPIAEVAAADVPSASAASAPTVLAWLAPMKGDQSLWWDGSGMSIDSSPPSAEAMRLASGYAMSAAAAETAHVAVGVQDADGMLVWVELPASQHPDAQTAASMDAVLASLGCSKRIALPGDARAALGGTLDVDGEPISSPAAVLASPSIRLVRVRAPDAHAIFTDTPIVPASVWQPLQAKRVRYFYKPAGSSSTNAVPATPSPGGAAVRLQSAP